MSAPIGVLFVGDSQADARAVEQSLRTGGYLPSVNQIGPAELDIALRRDLVEVAIVDFDLDDAEGLIRSIATPLCDLPVLVVGSSPAVEDAARAMRAGAHDYLLKRDLSYLPLAVERELREKRERARRVQAERRLSAGTERLLLEIRAQARAFKVLHEVALESLGSVDPAQIAGITVDRARKLIGADAVGLYWWNETSQHLDRLAVGTDLPGAKSANGLGVAELCFREGRPIVLDGARLAAVSPSVAQHVSTVFAVPLMANDRTVGALVAGLRREGGVDPESIELLRLFAAQVAPSLQASHLAAERDVQVRRLEALHRIAVAASGVLDPGELGRLVTDQARDLTDAWSAALNWLEPDGSVLVIHENHPANVVPVRRLVAGEGATGLALMSGSPVLIDDYQNWEDAAEWAVKAGIGSLLAIPLMVRDVALGCLVVRAHAAGHFQPDQVRILSLLAAQVGPSLEGARQARERDEQTSTFRALHEIAVAAGGVLDPAKLATLAVGNACDLLGVDGAVVFAWDQQSGLLQPLYETPSSSSEPPCVPGDGAVGLAFERCEPLVIDDYQQFGKAVRSSAARGMISAAAVPLIVGDRPVGVLGVWTYTTRKFTDSDVQVLTLFAAQLAPALEASRQAAERELQAHVFRSLHELAVAAGGVLDPVTLAELAIKKACDLLGGHSGVLVRFEHSTGTLVSLADNHPELGDGPRHPEAAGANGLAYRERAPVAIEDYATWEHALPTAVALGVQSVLAVPILVQDVVIGCLTVRWNQRREITPGDAQLLSLLAAEVGPSMEAARVAEEREVRARTFSALHDLAVAVGGVLDPGALARLATEHARDLLDAETSSLCWWDSSQERFWVLAENHPALRAQIGYPRDTVGVTGLAFQRGEPIAISDYQGSADSVEWARKLGIASVLAAPLLVDGRPVGCLLVRTNTVRDFSSDDVRLLSLLAAQVAPAIHAANLHLDLRKSEQSFRTIFEDAPVLVARNDLEGRIVDMNRTGLEMFGYTIDEVRDLTRYGLFADPPQDGERLEALRTGGLDRYRLDRRYRRKDGSIFWGSTTLSLVRDEAGEPDFYYAIVEDIDDRRRAADAIQQRADTFRALHELGLAASGILEPAALAESASLKAVELLAADNAGVLWLDENQETLHLLAGTRTDIPIGATIPFTGTGAEMLRRGEPLVLNDYAAWPEANPRAVERGVVSALIVPLQARDKIIGTLGVQCLTRRNFTPADVELLSLVAAAIGPAIEAARLHADLVDSEGRIRAIFRTAPMVIGRIDPQGMMVEMNPVLFEMTGYTVEEVIGHHFNDVPWADDGFIDRRSQGDLLKGRRERAQYEKHLRRKDGSHFWAEITVSTVRRPDRGIDFFYVMVKDVNERKVAEEALRKSEIRKGAIVSSALDCIVVADSEGRIMEFNPAAERAFGRTRDDVIGADIFEVISATRFRDGYRSQFAKYVQNEERTQHAGRLETMALRSDGTEFPIDVSIALFEQDGSTILSASLRDLSEREQAVAATRESEAKSRFLASMSHELRTPLNSILGFSQLLETGSTGPLNDRQKRYVGHIESSGRHLLALITEVLDLSKVAAGQMEVDVEDVDLVPLVVEALARVGPLGDSRPVELVLDPAPPLWVRADRRRLLQVLLNLLSNAIKFTPAGGVVRVGIARSGHEVEIAVVDTGIGISSEQREWIFEEFTQVQRGALDSQEGTGLGLALSRRLLTLMDGTIRLQSEVGQGSVFTVSLPRAIRRRERAQAAPPLVEVPLP